METFKKICKALLYPKMAIMITLAPISIILLIAGPSIIGWENLFSIPVYVLSAYTLTVWCFKIPYLINWFRAFKKDNKYLQKWQSDARLRINATLYGSLIWNAAYAFFQLGLGIYHRSFWFYSMAIYYICLGIMRAVLLRYSRNHAYGECVSDELRRYRFCGITLFFMNITLAAIMFYIIWQNKTFVHHEITTITLAAHTFITFTFAIINIFKYRKYKSPVFDAAKIVSLTAACVSMFTLETTMFTAFGTDADEGTRQIMMCLTGAFVSIFVLCASVYMIITATTKLKKVRVLTKAGSKYNNEM